MDFIVIYIKPADFADFLHLFIVSKEHVVGFYILLQQSTCVNNVYNL